MNRDQAFERARAEFRRATADLSNAEFEQVVDELIAVVRAQRQLDAIRRVQALTNSLKADDGAFTVTIIEQTSTPS